MLSVVRDSHGGAQLPAHFVKAARARDGAYVDTALGAPGCVAVVKELYRADARVPGALPVRAGRPQPNLNAARPWRDYVHDVADGGGRRRSDAPDPSWEKRNR